MTCQKFWLGVIGREKNVTDVETDEDEDTDDDEVIESDKTTSTEKRSETDGIFLYKLSCNRLPEVCLRIFFLLLNIIILFAGLTAIVISILMLIDKELTFRLVGQRLFTTILLILGILETIIALIGIVGIVQRRRSFIIFHLICQSLILYTILICAIMGFSVFDKIAKKIRNDMTYSIQNYQTLDSDREAWDSIQRYLKCCGIRSSEDWLVHGMNIPQSCCSSLINQCLHMTKDVTYKFGCLREAILLVKSYIYTVSISMLFISSFLLANVFLATGLRRRLKRR